MKLTMENLIYELTSILKNNAPVRTYPLGAVGKKGTAFYSPYPGNLRNNGIIACVSNENSGQVIIGGPVGYAVYTETTSHKPHWQEKSLNEFVQRLISYGGSII